MKRTGSKETRFLVQAAIIAAAYAALTIALMPISYGPMQVRISEALTVLPYFTPAAIPGLFVGCLIANILGPNGALDIFLGSGATLIAAIASYYLREHRMLVPLPPVIVNAVVIGAMLYYIYDVPSLPMCMLWVGAGQLVACYGVGYPLMRYMKRYESIFDLK